MRFPETSRTGSDAHVSAIRRLDQARAQQRRSAEHDSLAEGTAGAAVASRQLAHDDADLAAREAWLAWVELGV